MDYAEPFSAVLFCPYLFFPYRPYQFLLLVVSFFAVTIVNDWHNTVNCGPSQSRIFGFLHYTGGNVFKMELKILLLRDRFDILLEMRLSGAAKHGYTIIYVDC